MLSQEQLRAIPLLFSPIGTKKIAKQIGVSETTLLRWVRVDAEFRDAFASAQRWLVFQTMREIVTLSQSAVKALGELLQSENEVIKLGAVKTTLDHLHASYLCSEDILNNEHKIPGEYIQAEGEAEAAQGREGYRILALGPCSEDGAG